MSAIAEAVAGFEGIVNKFIPDPAQAAQAALEFTKLQMAASLAETNSTDAWTSRARPSFMYVMYIMILCCIPMGVFYAFDPASAANVSKGMQLWLAAIPKSLWDVFGLCFSIYSIARTHEKQPFFGGK